MRLASFQQFPFLALALRRRVLATVCAAILALHVNMAAAQDDPALPRLHTNEEYVSDVAAARGLDVENVMAVFGYVLRQLPARVRVFPTENYYYFYFYQGGIKFAGNLRFDVGARDEGFVEFIYFKATTDWFDDDRDYHATLGESDGVSVEKVEDFAYAVTYGGRRVVFELNDLSEVTPPLGALGSGETFLGPVADESGIRFFLTFDEKLKVFHYVLDETAPVADELIDITGLDHISVGRRTSFAFFRDPNFDRKLLVGVYEGNIGLNNYLDGPFDQLPDNFFQGDALRRAILLADPDADPEMDRLGIAPDGLTRQKIGPYLEYNSIADLAPLKQCAAETGVAVYTCLEEFVDGQAQ